MVAADRVRRARAIGGWSVVSIAILVVIAVAHRHGPGGSLGRLGSAGWAHEGRCYTRPTSRPKPRAPRRPSTQEPTAE